MDYDELITRIDTSDGGSGNIKSVLPWGAASVCRTDCCYRVTLNLRTTYNDEGKTERSSEVPPSNGLQFINITDPSQIQIPRNKKIVRSQAMRYARNRVRSNPHENQSSFHSGASGPLVLKADHAYIQLPGSATCSCMLPGDACRNQDCHEAPSIDLLATAARYCIPVCVPRSGRVDPFGMFPREMSPYMNFLLDYCK
jgi:hypothetical protein